MNTINSLNSFSVENDENKVVSSDQQQNFDLTKRLFVKAVQDDYEDDILDAILSTIPNETTRLTLAVEFGYYDVLDKRKTLDDVLEAIVNDNVVNIPMDVVEFIFSRCTKFQGLLEKAISFERNNNFLKLLVDKTPDCSDSFLAMLKKCPEETRFLNILFRKTFRRDKDFIIECIKAKCDEKLALNLVLNYKQPDDSQPDLGIFLPHAVVAYGQNEVVFHILEHSLCTRTALQKALLNEVDEKIIIKLIKKTDNVEGFLLLALENNMSPVIIERIFEKTFDFSGILESPYAKNLDDRLLGVLLELLPKINTSTLVGAVFSKQNIIYFIKKTKNFQDFLLIWNRVDADLLPEIAENVGNPNAVLRTILEKQLPISTKVLDILLRLGGKVCLSFKAKKYADEKYYKNIVENEECFICLLGFDEDPGINIECGHLAHKDCNIEKIKCPYCYLFY